MPETPGVVEYEYEPQEKQLKAHNTMVDELLYGGAAGGGKSRFARAELMLMALMVPGSRSIIFRRTYPDLEEVEDDLRTEMPPGVATYKPGKHRWEFRNGSIIRLAHLSREEDVYKYQGQSFALVVFEESTQFSPDQYTYLKGRLRVSGAVKDRMEELGWIPRMISTTNPGGRSHSFFKERFVDAAPHGEPFLIPPESKDGEPSTAVYIPATSDDNEHIDKGYKQRLDALPEERRRAYRDGDWDILAGVRFPQWRRSIHVVSPSDIPISGLTGRRVIAVDYGFHAPFAAVWLCQLHDGMVVQYREAYETELTAKQQAQLILQLTEEEEARTGEKIPVVMDSAMWARPDATGGKLNDPNAPPPGSPAHHYQTVLGRTPLRAYKSRVHGWNVLDEKLAVAADGYPRYLVHDTCIDTIRTVPALPRDKKNPEDVETNAEDHIADALRYGLMYLEGQETVVSKGSASRRRSSGSLTESLSTNSF